VIPSARWRCLLRRAGLLRPMDDFVPQVEKVLSVGEFYELSAGGEIIFT
jgi:hypothetical protein